MVLPLTPNQRRSLDFVSDQLTDGRRFRVLTAAKDSTRAGLSDGSRTTYFYAWKGGPRLPGKPGDPTFVAAYNAAVAGKVDLPVGTIQSILNACQATTKFADLARRTRKDCLWNIKQIEAEYGGFPIDALSDRRGRGEFLIWRDRVAVQSRRQADYVYSTFAAILA